MLESSAAESCGVWKTNTFILERLTTLELGKEEGVYVGLVRSRESRMWWGAQKALGKMIPTQYIFPNDANHYAEYLWMSF